MDSLRFLTFEEKRIIYLLLSTDVNLKDNGWGCNNYLTDHILHDVLIIGTGLAGLRSAIACAMRNEKLNIGVISKVQAMRSHSVSAEGGTAALLFSDEGDNIESHIYDTIRGSDFLCDQDVAEKLAH